MKEIWKDCVGYEGLYQVSNIGNIRRYKLIIKRDEKGHLKGYTVSKTEFEEHKKQYGKYVDIILRNETGGRREKVHRLVALAFIGTDDLTLTVDHIDENKYNNEVSNLQFISRGDNYRKSNTGDKHWTHKYNVHTFGTKSKNIKKQ